MTSSFAVTAPTNLSDNGYVTDKTSYLESSPFARWVFVSTATRVFMKVRDVIYSSFPAWAEIGIYVNGEYYATLPTSAIGENILGSDLPAGNKTVELVVGLQSKPASTVLGTFFKSVYFSGGVTNQQSASIGTMVVYGDSIAVGAQSDDPTEEGWPMIVRQSHPLIVEAWGYRTLFSDCPDAAGRTTFAAKIASYNVSVVWLAIGTNDYGLETWSAADFGTAYADLLDKLNAQLPNAIIYCQTMLTRTTETANSFGDTLGAYRTQIATAANARAYCTLVDGTSLVSIENLADGLHPSTAGHAEYAANVNAML